VLTLLSRSDASATRSRARQVATCDSPRLAEAHHVTVPAHSPLRIGTLAAILTDVAQHLEIDRDKLLKSLFG
jgi:hypothetical protein